MGCTFIGKAWVLYKWGIKPLKRATLHTSSFSTKEAREGDRDYCVRERIAQCLTFQFDDDNDEYKRWVEFAVDEMVDEKNKNRKTSNVKDMIGYLGRDQLVCDDDSSDDDGDDDDINLCNKLLEQLANKREKSSEETDRKTEEKGKKADERKKKKKEDRMRRFQANNK